MALAIVANPYEYRIASSQFINCATFSSSSKWTSENYIRDNRRQKRMGQSLQAETEMWLSALTHSPVKSSRTTRSDTILLNSLHSLILKSRM